VTQKCAAAKIQSVMSSCSSALRFPIETTVFALDTPQNAARSGPAESDQPHMLRGDSEFPGEGGVINTPPLLFPQCRLCWGKIFKAQFVAPNERERYRSSDIEVKKKIASAMHARELPTRIRGLRKRLGLNQKDFGAMCGGVKQVAVSQWESDTDPRVPSSKALFKMSELAPTAERQWWRDRAAEQAGVDITSGSTSGPLEIPELSRRIPLIKNPDKVGKAGSVTAMDVERILSFSPELLPEGGRTEAVRISTKSTDLIAVIDIAQQHAEHLIGKMVAVRKVDGIEIRWLAREDGAFLLLPFEPGQTVKAMRYKGEWSIVGAVKWVGDAPAPEYSDIGVKRRK
jgi:transcriptional regulator with XRE-family HTH domain